MNTAIIVAAGSGSRLDPARPKQFIEILGKPILAHTLERFEACRAVDEIVLVLPAEKVERFHAAGVTKLSAVVAGGRSRAESVRNGMAAADPSSEIIAVHDGARPLVTVSEIERTIAAAAETGAACLVAPVTDTIKEVCDGRVAGTIDRTRLRRAFTPQAFSRDIIVRAFAGIDPHEKITDECFLVEKLGVPIAAVEGSSQNIKITHAEDLILAENILKARSEDR